LQIKTKIVSCYSADSKPVKQEVNGTVILPNLVFPVGALKDENVASTTITILKFGKFEKVRPAKPLVKEKRLF
jgi:hypothetical protein